MRLSLSLDAGRNGGLTMARPFQIRGKWTARVKDAAGRWRNVALPEARTKREAEALAADLGVRNRRQRDGLDTAPVDSTLTVGGLLTWWLRTYSAQLASHGRSESTWNAHLRSSDLAALPVRLLTSGRIEAFLQAKAGDLAAASLNKLRGMIRTAWNCGRRAGKCAGPNPASEVKRRRVPKRKPTYLQAREVAPMLAKVPPHWRPLFATAVYTGLRKGELLGLARADVDLVRRQITVRHSYGRATKGAHEEAIPIARELVPFLEEALRVAPPGELCFPAPDGTMRSEETPLCDVLQRALAGAGLVAGYLHVCRWCMKTRPHEERHDDCEPRHCPACTRKLWAKVIPRGVRFHDLRHTTASLLLAAGVDLFAVQRILRHTDPKITSDVYAHLVPGYLHGAVDRLVLTPPAPVAPREPIALPAVASGAGFARQVLREADPAPGDQLRPVGKAGDSAGIGWRARRESNPRPSDSKGAHPALTLYPEESRSVTFRTVTGVEPSPDLPAITPRPAEFARQVLRADVPPPGRDARSPSTGSLPTEPTKPRGELRAVPDVLLTPRDVAARLGVCRDTVYRLVKCGELLAVRVGALVRIAPADLAAFLARSMRGARE